MIFILCEKYTAEIEKSKPCIFLLSKQSVKSGS